MDRVIAGDLAGDYVIGTIAGAKYLKAGLYLMSIACVVGALSVLTPTKATRASTARERVA